MAMVTVIKLPFGADETWDETVLDETWDETVLDETWDETVL